MANKEVWERAGSGSSSLYSRNTAGQGRVAGSGSGSDRSGGGRVDGSQSSVVGRSTGSRTGNGRLVGSRTGSGRLVGSGSGSARSAGSRYADKKRSAGKGNSGAAGRSGAGGHRPAPRRSRRRRKNRPWMIYLLLFLVLAVIGLAGVFLYARRREAADRGNAGGTRAPLTRTDSGTQTPQADPGTQENADAQTSSGSVDLDRLDSPYAILLDADSGDVLASKRGEEKIFPASMVKMMTVLTAIRSIGDLDRTVTMSYDFYDALYDEDASRAGFEPGEEARLRDLLYGALLPSGAECCMQLALEAAGSEAAFVEMMNQNALEMGLTQTHFSNATGLHTEDQYSTPHEIGLILREGLKNETFYKVFTTHYYTVQPTSVHPEGFTFWSTLFKNTTDDSVNGGMLMGGKTGFTNEAGHCLASMAEVNGREYILVTAGWAQNPEDELYHINDAFRAYNQIAS